MSERQGKHTGTRRRDGWPPLAGNAKAFRLKPRHISATIDPRIKQSGQLSGNETVPATKMAARRGQNFFELSVFGVLSVEFTKYERERVIAGHLSPCGMLGTI